MNRTPSPNLRQAAIAVIVRQEKLLVIERSLTVRAPGKLCFPGGEVEPGEHIAEAVIRELFEELGLRIQPIRPLWQSLAPSGCQLHWILAQFANPDDQPRPDPLEVASWHWLTLDELARHPDTLASNLEFLEFCRAGTIQLPG